MILLNRAASIVGLQFESKRGPKQGEYVPYNFKLIPLVVQE